MSGHNLPEQGLDADYGLQDPGDGGAIIPAGSPNSVALVTAAAETRTLPNPIKAGLRLTITLLTDGGDAVVTAASDIDMSGNNVITFADAGDTVELVSVKVTGGFAWRLVANIGATLA